MSHTHIRVAPPEPVKTNVGRGVAVRLLICLLLFGVVVIAVRFVEVWNEPVYVTINGQIEQTRVVVASTRATNYGGIIFYQIEALVSYQKNGQRVYQWLVASPPNRSREMLVSRISQKPTQCLVYWPEGDPDDVQCKIQDAWSNYPGLNP